MPENLTVVLGGRTAGQITRENSWSVPNFQYDDEYLARQMAVPFSEAFADALGATGLPEAAEVRRRAMKPLQAHVNHLVARLDDPPDRDTKPI